MYTLSTTKLQTGQANAQWASADKKVEDALKTQKSAEGADAASASHDLAKAAKERADGADADP